MLPTVFHIPLDSHFVMLPFWDRTHSRVSCCFELLISNNYFARTEYNPEGMKHLGEQYVFASFFFECCWKQQLQ